jgi:tRNA pseudouridine38-40 synthase
LNQPTHHFALGIEYDGSHFHGWQRQQVLPSVQATLEGALSQVADRPVKLTTAGRTDAGVHATGQVAGFATAVDRPLNAWLRGTNSLTPACITVHWVRRVDAAFNARFSASCRQYQYLVLESPTPPAVGEKLVTWSRTRLDVDAMHSAARHLLGEQDFTSVRAAGCQSNSPFRCVYSASVQRHRDLVVLDVCANAFLLHMVRNIAGALLRIGRGEYPSAWMGELLAARDRSLAGPTAPSAGLYLTAVTYPPPYDFPHAAPPLILRALAGR